MSTTKRSWFLVSILLGAVIEVDAGTVANITSQAEPSCLVLEWMDPHELLPIGERWIAKETVRVLAAADIGVRWDWSHGPRSSTREHRLRVVLVPSEPSGPGWRLPANTLGATVLDGVKAPPAVYIFYKTIAASLRLHRLGGRPETNSYFLGRASRALGRIIAHEIAHAIAPGEPHARDGLMRAGLAPEFFLAKGDVLIDEQWKRVLAQGMSRLCSKK